MTLLNELLFSIYTTLVRNNSFIFYFAANFTLKKSGSDDKYTLLKKTPGRQGRLHTE